MRRAIVVGEYRLFRGPDGAHYAESVFGRGFWDRYLEVFDEVVVVARTEARDDVVGMLRVDGDGVSVFEMPYYVGVAGYARNLADLRAQARQISSMEGAVILRLPGAVGGLVQSALPRDRPYGVELVGDPADVLSKGVVDHPLRRFLRVKAVRDLRRQCRRATTVAYVSRHQLEGRYPADDGVPTFAYSSATMPPAAFLPYPREFTQPLSRVIAVGGMEQMYKGFDVLIDAFACLVRSRPSLKLTIVGGGRYREALEAQVLTLGLMREVRFTGALSTPEEVRTQLDAAELFVSSSRTEGLPRTLIEAQARGLAAVGTSVGSTPELLGPDDLCPPDDVGALARLIANMIDDPDLASKNAARGRAGAVRYSEERLQAVRNDMFTVLRGQQEAARTVVHVLGSLDRGGAESVALDLVRSIPASEARQVFVCLSGARGVLAPEFEDAGAVVVPLGGHLFRRVASFWRLLRQEGADAVQAHVALTSGWLLLIAKTAGVRLRIARVHSQGDGQSDRPGRRAYRWCSRWALRASATHVLGVTPAALDFATGDRVDLWAEAGVRCEVIPNAVDLSRFHPAPDDAPRLQGSPPTVLHVGRADLAKNRKLLGPIARAVNVRRQVDFRVVGTDDLSDLGDDMEFLLVEGPRSDIADVYRECDALLLPSMREGLPGVVLEALASGLPVVASDLPGIVNLAEQLIGISTVPASAPPETWADAITSTLAGRGFAKSEISDAVRSSEFSLDRNVQPWRKVWGIGG